MERIRRFYLIAIIGMISALAVGCGKGKIEMSDMAKKMVERFDYPYTIFPEGTEYEEIMSVYEDKKRLGKEKGFLPVIVPVDDVLEDQWGIIFDDGYSVEEAIKAASAEDGEKILKQRFDENLQYSGMTLEDYTADYDGEPAMVNYASAFMDYSTSESVETIIFEVPTTNPWEAVIYLPFGGFNDCPKPETMAAVCKYWYEKYGAVPVTITHDILEMSVPEYVDEKDSLELAKEHYAFCADRVDQGTATYTISEVAASLAVSKVWYFWWD